MCEADAPTIMAVGAHHDDNELFAGTLARHQEAGWRVVSVVTTNGVWIRGKGSPEHTAIREAESLAAAKLLGMECEFPRFPEGDLQVTAGTRDGLVALVRKHSPRVIVTHPPRDYHWDHMQTSELTRQVVYQCGSMLVLPEVSPCAPPKLYYCDSWFVPFDPDEYIEVTDHLDLKLEMLACHKSQLAPEGPQEGDMIDLARVQSRHRGIEAGVKYAEAFRLATNIGSVRMSNLLR